MRVSWQLSEMRVSWQLSDKEGNNNLIKISLYDIILLKKWNGNKVDFPKYINGELRDIKNIPSTVYFPFHS
jgi:hypothetical protein